MSQNPAFSKLQLAGQNMSDDSSSSVDNVGLLSRDRWGGSWQLASLDKISIISLSQGNEQLAV